MQVSSHIFFVLIERKGQGFGRGGGCSFIFFMSVIESVESE